MGKWIFKKCINQKERKTRPEIYELYNEENGEKRQPKAEISVREKFDQQIKGLNL